jgi:glycosyltransferase involved in cell wall biosynthesis
VAPVSSVGVVVPCYRYGHLLAESVGSALDQRDVDVRVLIIDDASPDDSAEVARKLAAGDDRIEVVVHPRNAGHIATYNEGLLEWCDADYAVLLSADDRLTPDALTRAVALLDAHPEVGLAYGRVLRFSDSASLPVPRTRGNGWRIYPGQQWLRWRFQDGDGCITCPEVVVRTAMQHRLGGYRADLPHTGDIEMWMRFAANSDIGYLRGVDQAYYRVHDANMSKGYSGDRKVLDLGQRRAAFEAVLATQGHRIDDSAELERRMRRRLATDALYLAARVMDRSGSDAHLSELVDFAEQTYAGTHELWQFRSLRVRQRLGPRWSRRLQLSAPAAVVRRVRDKIWWASWRRRGVGLSLRPLPRGRADLGPVAAGASARR